jgi:hypothetical protein
MKNSDELDVAASVVNLIRSGPERPAKRAANQPSRLRLHTQVYGEWHVWVVASEQDCSQATSGRLAGLTHSMAKPIS